MVEDGTAGGPRVGSPEGAMSQGSPATRRVDQSPTRSPMRFLRDGTQSNLMEPPEDPTGITRQKRDSFFTPDTSSPKRQRSASPQREAPPVSGDEDVSLNTTQARKVMMSMANKSRLVRQERFRNEEEKRLQSLEQAAIKVQAWYKMTRVAYSGPLAFLYHNKRQRKENAATTVQRVYRAHVTRHSADIELRIEFRLLEHAAAVMLQKVTRGHGGRLRFRRLEASGHEAQERQAVQLLQRHVRGWKSRRDTKAIIAVKRAKVAVIERFCIHHFQPNQHEQNRLWNANLWSIVTVQAKARRFLAKRRSDQLLKTRKDMLAQGWWMALWAALLGLFLLATVIEKGGGAPSALREALGTHLDPLHGGQVTAADARTPSLVWDWLESGLIPRYRTLDRTTECGEAAANARQCADISGMAVHVAARLAVRQQRGDLALFELPGAGLQDVLEVCGGPRDVTGGVCKMRKVLGDELVGSQREAALQGLPITVNVSNASELAAATLQRDYITGNYSTAPEEVLLGVPDGEEDQRRYGSVWLNFSYRGGVGLPISGRYGAYAEGGYDLQPALSNGSFVSLGSEESTECGIPCEQGVRRVRLAEWLDAQTRAIITEVGVISMENNVLAIAQTVVEFTRGGRIRATRQLRASRFEAYESFGGLPDLDPSAVAASRSLLHVVFVLAGLSYLIYTFWTTHYVVHTFPNKRTRIRRRDGTLWHRVKHHFSIQSNTVDLVVGILVLSAGVLRLVAQSTSRTILQRAASPSLSSISNLADLHQSSDQILAVVAVCLWSRGIVMYISTIRIVRVFYAVAMRVLMPVVSVAICMLCAVFALAHIATLTRGRMDPRFASLYLSLGTVLQTMLEGASLEEWGGDTALPPRREWVSYRGAEAVGGQSGAEFAASYFLGLVVAACVGAISIAHVQDEMGVTREMETSPYLFKDGHRLDRYRPWDCPPLTEVWHYIRTKLRSKRSKAEEMRLYLMQFRVLTQLRKRTSRALMSAFTWRLVHDKATQLDIARKAKASLRRVSRLMGHQRRAFDRSADLVELAMEETTVGMLDNATKLLRKGFTFSDIAWPHANLTLQDIENAERIVEEEREAALDEKVIIPARKMKTLDKQLIYAESVAVEAAEKWGELLKVEAAREAAKAHHVSRRRRNSHE